jgi:succinate-acetate transporter protein
MDSKATDSREDMIRKIRTNDSVAIPLDVFEKLYLSPQQRPGGIELGKKFGNPTPVALIGFLLSSTPNACALMGWRGAGGGGGAILTVFIFFGGLLCIIGAAMEWVLGNTFPCCLFFTYGMTGICRA